MCGNNIAVHIKGMARCKYELYSHAKFTMCRAAVADQSIDQSIGPVHTGTKCYPLNIHI